MYCFAKFCRLCLQQNDNLIDFQTKDSDNITYLNKIKTLIPSLFVSNDDFIGLICENCRHQIRNFYSFINNCFKINEQLIKYNCQLNFFGRNKHNDLKIILDKYNIPVVECFTKNELIITNDIINVEIPEIQINETLNPLKPKRKRSKQNCVCPSCGKHYTNKATLERHYANIHLNIKYKCHLCNKSYNQMNALTYHERTIHLNLKKYECYLCGHKFPLPYKLRNHLKSCAKQNGKTPEIRIISTNLPPNKCHICNKSFAKGKALQSHYKTIHLGGTHRCTICMKRFVNIENLHDHEMSVHRDHIYKCDLCAMDFKRMWQLQDHLISHTAQHTCTKCGKKIPEC